MIKRFDRNFLRVSLTAFLVAGSFLQVGLTGNYERLRKRSQFNAKRLKVGTFTYRDTGKDKSTGESQIRIEDVSGACAAKVRFSVSVTGKLSQHWEAVVKSTFEPISANLTFGGCAGNRAFDLKYSSGHVTGFVVDRKGLTPDGRLPVDQTLPPNVVDQRLDWAAVSASDLNAGQTFEFYVYDPSIGVSDVRARVGDPKWVDVAAGKFRVYPVSYEIRKPTGTENYRVSVTEHEPRMLIREEFPDGTISDLISVAPATQPRPELLAPCLTK